MTKETTVTVSLAKEMYVKNQSIFRQVTLLLSWHKFPYYIKCKMNLVGKDFISLAYKIAKFYLKQLCEILTVF